MGWEHGTSACSPLGFPATCSLLAFSMACFLCPSVIEKPGGWEGWIDELPAALPSWPGLPGWHSPCAPCPLRGAPGPSILLSPLALAPGSHGTPWGPSGPHPSCPSPCLSPGLWHGQYWVPSLSPLWRPRASPATAECETWGTCTGWGCRGDSLLLWALQAGPASTRIFPGLPHVPARVPWGVRVCSGNSPPKGQQAHALGLK